MYILLSEPNGKTSTYKNGTEISIQSKLNGNLISVKNEELVCDTDKFTDAERFFVYYAQNNIIGLKSKYNGKFIGASLNRNQALKVDRENFNKLEMFKIVQIFEKYLFLYIL